MARHTTPRTVPDLLVDPDRDRLAIFSPSGQALAYQTLRSEVLGLASQLRSNGIAPGDRVALVLPNGPELAISALAAMSAAAAAPLNPAYREAEFRFFLEDMGAAALITRPGDAEAARAALPAGAVHFELVGEPGLLRLRNAGAAPVPDESMGPSPDAVALVLHTSGTTSRPKLVPLTHRNLVTSAGNVARSLALTPDDRCLNVMPLFHIHGLVAALLGTLVAGSSVVCTEGFNAFKLWGWLADAEPTWLTAVPSMYQALLLRTSGAQPGGHLRFMRSSSAPMPESVITAIEETFGVPLIEAYGMTEASHQISSNPLPPGDRRPGSVGIPQGVEVKIDSAEPDADGVARGEVIIRGPSVVASYGGGASGQEALQDGWFHTGDEGYLLDGYLYLTGRIKEMINRGGEKISPREIDEVLLAHPDVQQAIAFAVPHPLLGEDVAAAVVTAPGRQILESELREYARERIAGFKVPRRIVFVDEIPMGPTGKLQRIGLAEKLGLAD